MSNKTINKHLFVYDAAGRVGQFTQAWLRASLEQAARNAACDPVPLVEDVTTAVSAYLERVHRHSIIRLVDFTELMRHTLRSIGYPEVASVLRIAHPCRKLSLLECLPHVPPNTEAVFYRKLQTLIETCHAESVQRLELSDLAACAELLPATSQAFPWHPAANARQSIVTFVRRQITRLKWREPLYCSIT